MNRCLLMFLFAVWGGGQFAEAQPSASVEELSALYDAKDFFALAERLPGLDASEPRQAFFAGQVDAAFRRDDRAETELRVFVASPAADAEGRREAWLTLGNARLRHGDYPGAAQALEEALGGSAAHFSAARKLDAEQNLALARVLGTTPAQRTSGRSKPARLPVVRDRFGLLHIDVRINGQPERGMFDTLANGNVASETFARRHGLRTLDGNVELQAITGKLLAARVGVADEVQIGGMTFQHVVFTILPSQTLALPGSGDDSSLIIGLPLITALERVRFDARRNELEVGLLSDAARPDAATPNLAFDGLTPLVRVQYRRQALPFVLDTGMQHSKLLTRFGERFPQALAAAGARTAQQIGVGSSARLRVRVVPAVELGVGGVPVRLEGVTALTEEMSFLPRVFGVLGADSCKNGFELDFRAMRFRCRGNQRGGDSL